MREDAEQLSSLRLLVQNADYGVNILKGTKYSFPLVMYQMSVTGTVTSATQGLKWVGMIQNSVSAPSVNEQLNQIGKLMHMTVE